jgi:hypothetical protein
MGPAVMTIQLTLHGRTSRSKKLIEDERHHARFNTPSDVTSTLPVEAAAISLPGELKGHKHYDAQLEKDLAELRKQYPRAVSQPDARLVRLKNYFEQMGSSLPEVTTLRLSDEVKDMLIDPAQVRDEKRSQVCSDDDLRRVVELELEAGNLEAPDSWTWDPKPGSDAEKYAEERMRYWLEEQTAFRVLEKCPQCHCSDILMGRERESDYCRDCMTLARRGKQGEKKRTKVSYEIKLQQLQKYEI